MRELLSQLRPAALAVVVLTVITGGLYPLAVTAAAHVAFPSQAGGSLIERDGVVVGSALIGQPFSDPRYFWSRPSATADSPYNAMASSPDNLGPTNPDLVTAVAARVAALRAADPASAALPVPIDLVTTSASGLDPDISPAAAIYQIARIARVRGLDAAEVRGVVDAHTAGRVLGILGDPHVNVLELNLALDGATR